ncbi:MAG: hypothetical protein ACYDDF_08910 [Thermoplasmatota archaeon]
MKLRKTMVRRVKGTGTRLYRHDITVPERVLKDLGWTKDTNLRVRVHDDGKRAVIERDE